MTWRSKIWHITWVMSLLNREKKEISHHTWKYAVLCIVYYFESWTTLLLNPTLTKDESLWSSHWCLIRTHSFIHLMIKSFIYKLHLFISPYILKQRGAYFGNFLNDDNFLDDEGFLDDFLEARTSSLVFTIFNKLHVCTIVSTVIWSPAFDDRLKRRIRNSGTSWWRSSVERPTWSSNQFVTSTS